MLFPNKLAINVPDYVEHWGELDRYFQQQVGQGFCIKNSSLVNFWRRYAPWMVEGDFWGIDRVRRCLVAFRISFDRLINLRSI